MKALCKKNIRLKIEDSNSFGITYLDFKKGEWYNVTEFVNDESFNKIFITLPQYRKEKLNKICSK